MMNANTLNKYDINGCVKSMDFMMMMMVISWLRSVGVEHEKKAHFIIGTELKESP